MPRMRNREEICGLCKGQRSVTINLDDDSVYACNISKTCIRNPAECMQDVRDKARLGPYEDGKTRIR